MTDKTVGDVFKPEELGEIVRDLKMVAGLEKQVDKMESSLWAIAACISSEDEEARAAINYFLANLSPSERVRLARALEPGGHHYRTLEKLLELIKPSKPRLVSDPVWND